MGEIICSFLEFVAVYLQSSIIYYQSSMKIPAGFATALPTHAYGCTVPRLTRFTGRPAWDPAGNFDLLFSIFHLLF